MSVRVKVCLSKIFNDYRKEAFVNVDQNLKFVSDFEKHIQKLFNIQFAVYLTIGGSFLPSHENVNVIHCGDIIIINKLDKEANNGYELPAVSSIDNDTRQTIEIGNQSSEENYPSKRGKRIRKRKRKISTENDVEIRETTSTETIQKKLIVRPKESLKKSEELSELSLTKFVRTGHVKCNSHIRFSNFNAEIDVPTTPKNNFVVSQARVIHPVTVLTDAGHPVSKDIQLVSKPDRVITQDCGRGLSSLKEFANDSNFGEVVASIDFEDIIKSIESSNEFVTLKEEPKTYDVLAFKMLKIGKNYEPQLSEWIIAMVKDVEGLDMALRILAGADETSCPDGKLSMEIEGECEPSDIITLKRSDLLNVKVFQNE